MKKLLLSIAAVSLAFSLNAKSLVVADFEDGSYATTDAGWNENTISFTVLDNPAKDAINSSEKALYVDYDVEAFANNAFKCKVLPDGDSWANYDRISFKVYEIASGDGVYGKIQTGDTGWVNVFGDGSIVAVPALEGYNSETDGWVKLTFSLKGLTMNDADQYLYIVLQPYGYYIDDIALETTEPINFEDGTNPVSTSWGSIDFEVVANPASDDVNSSSKVLRVTNSATWGDNGWQASLLPDGDSWANYTHVSFKVYGISSVDNVWGQVKLSNNVAILSWNDSGSGDGQYSGLSATGWAELRWDIRGVTLDDAYPEIYVKLNSASATYYIDDVLLIVDKDAETCGNNGDGDADGITDFEAVCIGNNGGVTAAFDATTSVVENPAKNGNLSERVLSVTTSGEYKKGGAIAYATDGTVGNALLVFDIYTPSSYTGFEVQDNGWNAYYPTVADGTITPNTWSRVVLDMTTATNTEGVLFDPDTFNPSTMRIAYYGANEDGTAAGNVPFYIDNISWGIERTDELAEICNSIDSDLDNVADFENNPEVPFCEVAASFDATIEIVNNPSKVLNTSNKVLKVTTTGAYQKGGAFMYHSSSAAIGNAKLIFDIYTPSTFNGFEVQDKAWEPIYPNSTVDITPNAWSRVELDLSKVEGFDATTFDPSTMHIAYYGANEDGSNNVPFYIDNISWGIERSGLGVEVVTSTQFSLQRIDDITIYANNSSLDAQYYVIDAAGRVVLQGQPQNGVISIATLNRGIYLIQVLDGKNRVVEKIVR